MSTVHPTHTCFDDALDYMAQRLQRSGSREAFDELSGRLFLVHALCVMPSGPQAGEVFSHAWVEEEPTGPGEDVTVWQDGYLSGERITYGVPREDHCRDLKPSYVRRYSVRQAWEENRRTETFGPWDPAIQAFCREKGST